MALFYFTRNCYPSQFASSWLVAGVIEAESADHAAANLDAVLSPRKTDDSGSSFRFVLLDTAEKSEGGLLAITMGSR